MINNNDTDFDFTRYKQERQQKLLGNFYQVTTIAATGSLPLYIALFIFAQSGSLLTLIWLVGIIIVCLLTGYWFTRNGNLGAGIWILIWVAFGAATIFSWAWGTGTPLLLAYTYSIFISVLFCTIGATVWLTIASIAAVMGLYLVQDVLKWFVPFLQSTGLTTIFSIAVTFILFAIFLGLLIFLVKNQQVLSDVQNLKLEKALDELKNRQRTGSVMSQQIIEIVSQLNITANQQASGSQQQVSNVTEIAQSIEELSATATNISEVAGQVNEVANNIDRQSFKIEEMGVVSVTQSENGLNSAEETVIASGLLEEKYQQLLTTIHTLKSKSQDMRRILTLMSNIASETHLLSLNAAIEAAGAGEHGARFGVVAQETKNLALRSGTAGKEVVDIINQIEDTVNTTLTIVEEGVSTAGHMLSASGQTYEVVKEMGEVVKAAHNQAATIRSDVKNILDLAQMVNLATSQQRSASQQILQAIRELSAVSQQFAQNSNTLSGSADNLEGLSNELNVALVA
jgi:methyl-accepting chemotaxis protein